MDLEALSNRVETREQLAQFVSTLREDLLARPSLWPNDDLESFLEAMSGWIGDMDGYFRNEGEPLEEVPTWKTLARILVAARVYE